MHAPAATIQCCGPPLALPDIAQLEIAPDRLRLAKLPAQHLLLESLLRGFPFRQARLERVRRVNLRAGFGARHVAVGEQSGADAVAQDIVETRCRGRRRAGGHVGKRVGTGRLRDQPKRLGGG